MSTETTNKKIKIDNGTTFGRTYTDKAIDAKLPTDLIASANKISLGAGNTALGNGVNLSGFTYDEATKTLKANGGGGSISVIELTDKNGTIASTQLGEINANPQNFAFKYKGKILLFTSADSTNHQYCNNTTSSSDNNVMTTSALLTITSSTGAYTIAENVHNVVANSIHPANGGDLTNIQVGTKVYSIPSGGVALKNRMESGSVTLEAKQYSVGEFVKGDTTRREVEAFIGIFLFKSGSSNEGLPSVTVDDAVFIPWQYFYDYNKRYLRFGLLCIKAGTVATRTYETVYLRYVGKE